MADQDGVEKTKKHALNHSKLGFSAQCPNVPNKRSFIRWDFWMNNPRLTVHTNDPADQEKDYGKITAPMDTPTAYAFLELLKKCIDSPKEIKYKIENFSAKFKKDKQGPMETVHNSDLWVGKDKEGVVFISLISKKHDMAIVRFDYGPPDSRFHRFIHGDGTMVSKEELSVLYAKGHYEQMKNMLSDIAVTQYTEVKPWKPGENTGYSNNYKEDYSKGNSEKVKETTEEQFEDFPF